MNAPREILLPKSVEHPSDELNVFDLFWILWRGKFIILVSIFLALLIALVYLYRAPVMFRVSSVLRPPPLNHIEVLSRSGFYVLTPDDALARVAASLESYNSRWRFFSANPELFAHFTQPGSTAEQSFAEFNNQSISVVLPDGKTAKALGAFVRVEYTYPRGVDGARLLNAFVAYVLAREQQVVLEDLKGRLQNRIVLLEDKISASRTSYEFQKQSTIALLLETDDVRRAQLKDELQGLRTQLNMEREARMQVLAEAIKVAIQLGIQKPTTPAMFSRRVWGEQTRAGHTEVNNQDVPLYFLGVDVLNAEYDVIKNRTSDDFVDRRVSQITKELQLLQVNRKVEELRQRKDDSVFLTGVDDARSEMASLSIYQRSVDQLSLGLAAIDQQAVAPGAPFKPKTLLVLGLALVGGLMLGMVLALAFGLIRSHAGNWPGRTPTEPLPI